MVTEGIPQQHLRIGGELLDWQKLAKPIATTTLDGYMLTYGPLLGKQAEQCLQPLHIPGRDRLPPLDLGRDPFEAQSHVIEATRKALHRQRSVLLVGEMGTGKTIMAMGAVDAHSDGRPYRALVFCPGQLVQKWERELRETVPGAEIHQIECWKNLLRLRKAKHTHNPVDDASGNAEALLEMKDKLGLKISLG